MIYCIESDEIQKKGYQNNYINNLSYIIYSRSHIEYGAGVVVRRIIFIFSNYTHMEI